MMKELSVTSHKRNEMIDITRLVQNVIDQTKIREGIVVVCIPHTTAGITINEGADPNVQHDIITTLDKLIPENGQYSHREGNSDAHIKVSLLGSSVTVLITKGQLVLGTWQHIFLYEGDGPRKRKVYLTCIAEC
jgi:secondary thiamine-phosphate synthase enzyme